MAIRLVLAEDNYLLREGVRKLIETQPELELADVGVVVLSQYADPSYALQLLENGSRGRGYLLKERVSDIDQLLAVVRGANGFEMVGEAESGEEAVESGCGPGGLTAGALASAPAGSLADLR